MNSSQSSSEPRCKVCGTRLDNGGEGEVCLRCALEHAAGTGTPSPPAPSTAVGRQAAAPPSAPDFAPEAAFPHLFGDYELLEEVGRGGMGVVYKARQVSLDRIVAIKMLLLGPLAKPEFVQRFRTEAAAAASLQHPNIVAIHEVGFREGQHYFAMDYVAGRSLADIVRDGPLQALAAVACVKSITEAIQYAHERGILHRDLKPSNVLMDEQDQPKVMDFGLAKRLEKETELTLSGQVLGSPNYMSPEQASAHRGLVGKRSDIYSLGAILYHLLTGRAPFAAPTVGETLQQVQTAEPISPTVLNPHLPRDLKTICLKCLEKEPARRYQTAQELADDLGRWLRKEPILARPMSRPEKVWRWCRRKPVIALLMAAVAAMFLLGLAGVTWQAQKATQARDLAQRRRYAAQMSQGFRAWQMGNLRLARALLETNRPPPGAGGQPSVEWRLLWSLCQNEAKEVLPTRGEWMIVNAEPSRDGRRLAMAGWSTNITIYDLAGGVAPQILRGHKRELLNPGLLAFSRDGRRLASAAGGPWRLPGPCELFLWDLATGNYTPLAGHSNWLFAVAYSPDGRWLGSGCLDGTVGLWDAQACTNLALLSGHEGSVYAAVFSPNSQSLFTGGEDGTVRCWDVTTRREVGPPLIHGLAVKWVAVAPNGKLLATAGADYYLRLWDLTTRQGRKLAYDPVEKPGALVFSPDSQRLAFGAGNNIRIWDLLKDRETTVLRGSEGPIVSLRFLPDGNHLVSASEFDRPMLWDLERSEKLITLPEFGEAVCSMTLSADQRWLVAGSGDLYDPDRPAEVLVFDFASRELVLPPIKHPAAVNSVSLTTNNEWLATGCADGHVRLFTLPGGQLIRTLTNAVNNKPGNVIFSPDGRELVTSAAPKQLTRWNTATWEATVLLRKVPWHAQTFTFSPDGTLLVTPLATHKCAIVWNMPAGTTNAVLPTVALASGAAFSPDGTILALKAFRDITLFETKTWKPLGTLRGHEHTIWAMAFAPDGKTLASAGFEGSLRLWSVPALAEVAALYDLVDWPQTVAFTADGHWLISGSKNKTVKLWSIPTLEEIRAAESPNAVRP